MKISRKTVLSIAYALLFLPGVAACFLVFTAGASPFDVFVYAAAEFYLKDIGLDDSFGLVFFVPYSLAIPII